MKSNVKSVREQWQLLMMSLLIGLFAAACDDPVEDDDDAGGGDLGTDSVETDSVEADGVETDSVETDVSDDMQVDLGTDSAVDLASDAGDQGADAAVDLVGDAESGDIDAEENGDIDAGEGGDIDAEESGDIDAAVDVAEDFDVLGVDAPVADVRGDAADDSSLATDAPFASDAMSFRDVECPRERALWPDVQIEEYASIPALESLDLDEVNPAAETTYWELRFGFFDETPEVVASSGTLCEDASDAPTCREAFSALSSDTGFGTGCLPGYCFYYVAVNRGDSAYTITSAEELRTFFGPIDTDVEAVLYAKSLGYDWRTEDLSAGGIRQEEDGDWRLLLTDLVAGCDPVVYDRIDLRIPKDAPASVLRQHEYHVLCGACI